MKNFNTLSEREILALAISLEEEDERVYADFAEGLKQDFRARGADRKFLKSTARSFRSG
jgi:rubrerythrin